jgi:hypothetical protein
MEGGNMSILNAIFRYEGTEEIINLEDISIREDYEVLKENLFCSSVNCNCPLQYIARGRISEYLKKRIGEIHIESCRHFAPTNLNGRSRRITGTTSTILRDDHVANILRGLHDAYNETDEERQIRLARQRESARQRRNNRVNNNSTEDDYDEVTVKNGTTSGSGEVLLEGERNPPVRRRTSLSDLTNEDIGQTEGIIGELIEIQNYENRSILLLSDRNRRRNLYVYLEQVFFENSPVNTNNRLIALNEILVSGRKIQISCVGEVVFRNDSLGLLAFRETYLRVNREPLLLFLHHSDN